MYEVKVSAVAGPSEACVPEQTERRARHVPAPRRFSMITNRVRLRPVLTAVIALLPLILAACKNGGSSGY